MKAKAAIIFALLALTVPAGSSARSMDEFGSITTGPIVPAAQFRPWLWGENPTPPIGCRSVEGWHSGHDPLAAYRDYQFHLRVSWCWSSDSWITGTYGYDQIAGRHFTTVRVRTWWSDPANVHYDDTPQLTIRKFDCWVDGTTVHNGCLYVLAVGQVDHPAVPLAHFAGITAHPWVKIVVASDGKVVSGDYSRSII